MKLDGISRLKLERSGARRPAITLGLVLVLRLSAAAHAGDWAQWRGPNRASAWNESGILQTFPAEGLQIRWRTPVGPGFSSPVVARGRVFVTDAELKNPKIWERVHCFDEKTGRRLWTFSNEVRYAEGAFEQEKHGSPPGPCPTPAVESGYVFSLGSTGHLLCLDARMGRVIWQKSLGAEYGLDQFPNLTTCPLIEGDLLIVVIGGKPGACVVALDKRSGKEVWRALDDPRTFSSPAIFTAGGKRQFLVWTPKGVISLDPATGKTWCREELATPENYVVATPVSQGDLLLISGLMFQLARSKPSASVLWPESKAISVRVLSHTCIPLILGPCVFAWKISGHLTCLDARTGKQLWESDKVTGLKYGATIHMTPNGDSVLIFTHQGNLIRARLGPTGYQELSRVHLLDPTYLFGDHKVVWPPPAFAHRQVFARNDQEIICASLAAKP